MNHYFNKKQSLLVILSLLSISLPAFASELLTIKNELKEQQVELNATIEAVDQATLSAQTSGRVTKINFDTNDYVEVGSVLLEITNLEQGAQVNVAEAEVLRTEALYNESQLTYQRYKRLYPQGAVSKGQLDQAEANANTNKQLVNAAKANLKKTKESLDYTIIKAPFSGVVTKRYVEIGETITPGMPLFSGMSLKKLRAVTEVPQRYLQALNEASQFIITLANGKQLLSTQMTLFNYADNQSHAFKVRIDLPQSDELILPGMWVKAQFVSGVRPIISIPTKAVLTNNELNAVYRERNGKAVLTQIRLGKSQDGYVEVLAGLKEGDSIFSDAYQQLQVLESNNE
jgi:RND family efflux transporter MFP subunit